MFDLVGNNTSNNSRVFRGNRQSRFAEMSNGSGEIQVGYAVVLSVVISGPREWKKLGTFCVLFAFVKSNLSAPEVKMDENKTSCVIMQCLANQSSPYRKGYEREVRDI